MQIKTNIQYHLPVYRLYMIISILLFSTSCTKPWEEMDHVYYQDDIYIDSLADITEAERILMAGYNAIDGDVYIEGYFEPSDLSFFKNIYEITGTLKLLGFPPVEVFKRLVSLGALEIYETDTINDFQNLRTCNEIYFYDCDIRYFTGFNELEKINKFKYEANEVAVERFNAFPNIKTVFSIDLSLKQDPEKVFEGFTNLTECHNLRLDSVGNTAFFRLAELSGSLSIIYSLGDHSLKSLRKTGDLGFFGISNREISLIKDSLICGYFFVYNTDLLTSFKGSPRLDSVFIIEIGSCNSITTLDGLRINNRLDYLGIGINSMLTDFCGIMGVEAEESSIHHNRYNPTLEEINSGKCKMK